jgi:predicted permease
MTMREWVGRLLDTVRPRRGDAELEEELRVHLELAAEDEQKRSGSAADGRRAAVIRLGGPAQALDAMRDQRGLPRLNDFLQDVRHSSRSLRKAPGFAVMAVVTLGAGLGATATVFSAVDALLLRPLAIEKPHELVVFGRTGEARSRFPLTFYRALSESGTPLAQPVASFTFPVTLVVDGTGALARAAFITPNYFDVLGVRPILGQLSDRPDRRDVMVISHRLWKERFGGRPTVGEVVRVGRSTFVIGGVAPPSFGGLQLDVPLDLWIPLSATSQALPIPSLSPSVDIVGRLRDGVSIAAVTSQANAAHRRWTESAGSASAPRPAPPLTLTSASHGLDSGVRQAFRASLGALTGICVCLWVITIVNVSGLLTARLDERSREIGLRQALGATSSRLLVQLLAEILVLMSGGVILGFALSVALSSAIPRSVPSWAGIDLHVSPFVLVATALTATLAAFVVALVLAFSLHRRSLMSRLAPSLVQFGARRVRVSTCLVGIQLALTLPLLAIAGMLAQSLYVLGQVDTGFDRRNLLQVRVEPALVGYSGEQSRAYYAALVERLRAIPGVVDASTSSGGALSGYDGQVRLRYGGDEHVVQTNAIDERYFGTMGIRLVAGRSLDQSEARGQGAVILVNDGLARLLFGVSERAVGQMVTIEQGPADEQRTVVGVVENTADSNLRDTSTLTAYLPVAQSGLLMVHVRVVPDVAGTAAAVRRAAQSLDPSVPILRIDTIEGRRQHSLQRERLLAATSTAIGWVALLLSAVGLFGRVGRDVVVRTRELVIRSALGATPLQIANLFLGDTARVLLFSAVPGVGAAVIVARVMKGQMFGISGADPTMYVGAVAALAFVAIVATILPLRRLSRHTSSIHLLRV